MSVLITGASSGLGRGLAVLYGKRGQKIYAAARRKSELDALVDEIKRDGGQAEAIELDVADADRTEALVRELDGRAALELVIANAGIGRPTPGTDISWKNVKDVMQVNVLGALATVCGALPGMVARKNGHIVGVSSLAGLRGLPKNGAYSASKAALSCFLESLRVDLQDSGVYVTDVWPGFVSTAMNAGKDRPFMLTPDQAVNIIARSIENRDPVCAFPVPTALAMRTVSLLPRPLYDFVASQLRGKL